MLQDNVARVPRKDYGYPVELTADGMVFVGYQPLLTVAWYGQNAHNECWGMNHVRNEEVFVLSAVNHALTNTSTPQPPVKRHINLMFDRIVGPLADLMSFHQDHAGRHLHFDLALRKSPGSLGPAATYHDLTMAYSCKTLAHHGGIVAVDGMKQTVALMYPRIEVARVGWFP